MAIQPLLGMVLIALIQFHLPYPQVIALGYAAYTVAESSPHGYMNNPTMNKQGTDEIPHVTKAAPGFCTIMTAVFMNWYADCQQYTITGYTSRIATLTKCYTYCLNYIFIWYTELETYTTCTNYCVHYLKNWFFERYTSSLIRRITKIVYVLVLVFHMALIECFEDIVVMLLGALFVATFAILIVSNSVAIAARLHRYWYEVITPLIRWLRLASNAWLSRSATAAVLHCRQLSVRIFIPWVRGLVFSVPDALLGWFWVAAFSMDNYWQYYADPVNESYDMSEGPRDIGGDQAGIRSDAPTATTTGPTNSAPMDPQPADATSVEIGSKRSVQAEDAINDEAECPSPFRNSQSYIGNNKIGKKHLRQDKQDGTTRELWTSWIKKPKSTDQMGVYDEQIRRKEASRQNKFSKIQAVNFANIEKTKQKYERTLEIVSTEEKIKKLREEIASGPEIETSSDNNKDKTPVVNEDPTIELQKETKPVHNEREPNHEQPALVQRKPNAKQLSSISGPPPPPKQIADHSPPFTTFNRTGLLNPSDFPLTDRPSRDQATGIDSRESYTNRILGGGSILTRLRRQQQAASSVGADDRDDDTNNEGQDVGNRYGDNLKNDDGDNNENNNGDDDDTKSGGRVDCLSHPTNGQVNPTGAATYHVHMNGGAASTPVQNPVPSPSFQAQPTMHLLPGQLPLPSFQSWIPILSVQGHGSMNLCCASDYEDMEMGETADTNGNNSAIADLGDADGAAITYDDAEQADMDAMQTEVDAYFDTLIPGEDSSSQNRSTGAGLPLGAQEASYDKHAMEDVTTSKVTNLDFTNNRDSYASHDMSALIGPLYQAVEPSNNGDMEDVITTQENLNFAAQDPAAPHYHDAAAPSYYQQAQPRHLFIPGLTGYNASHAEPTHPKPHTQDMVVSALHHLPPQVHRSNPLSSSTTGISFMGLNLGISTDPIPPPQTGFLNHDHTIVFGSGSEPRTSTAASASTSSVHPTQHVSGTVSALSLVFGLQQSTCQAEPEPARPAVNTRSSRDLNSGFSNLPDLTGQAPDTGVVPTTESDAQNPQQGSQKAKAVPNVTGYGSSSANENRNKGNDCEKNRGRSNSAEFSDISSLHSDEIIATEDQLAANEEAKQKHAALSPEARAELKKHQADIDARNGVLVFSSSEESQGSDGTNYYAGIERRSDAYDIEAGESDLDLNSPSLSSFSEESNPPSEGEEARRLDEIRGHNEDRENRERDTQKAAERREKITNRRKLIPKSRTSTVVTPSSQGVVPSSGNFETNMSGPAPRSPAVAVPPMNQNHKAAKPACITKDDEAGDDKKASLSPVTATSPLMNRRASTLPSPGEIYVWDEDRNEGEEYMVQVDSREVFIDLGAAGIRVWNNDEADWVSHKTGKVLPPHLRIIKKSDRAIRDLKKWKDAVSPAASAQARKPHAKKAEYDPTPKAGDIYMYADFAEGDDEFVVQGEGNDLWIALGHSGAEIYSWDETTMEWINEELGAIPSYMRIIKKEERMRRELEEDDDVEK
ncbi:hypothetical protein DE146DRAFT_732446 [Phaeosphaeria sp. MPI-PUGE-AT-0046c]|nr:hypothetical protein DE146DRAFT_732446 [Phaeosphaeria sp. MPI-PUGE-AT-0046c]